MGVRMASEQSVSTVGGWPLAVGNEIPLSLPVVESLTTVELVHLFDSMGKMRFCWMNLASGSARCAGVELTALLL